MKTTEKKYLEAVQRNFQAAQVDRFEDMDLSEVKHKLGIRQNDSRYDDKIRGKFNVKV